MEQLVAELMECARIVYRNGIDDDSFVNKTVAKYEERFSENKNKPSENKPSEKHDEPQLRQLMKLPNCWPRPDNSK